MKNSFNGFDKEQLLNILLYAYVLGEKDKKMTPKKMVRALSDKLKPFYE
ncbi:hypothetical protein [Alteribacillus sp. YIM 98480]|nr:hypothetical protein [Alteribacillus sp. YIM 98480]